MKYCISPGCGKCANLQCPNCLKLGIEDSYFCSQECFKQNWNDHKSMHKKAKEILKEPGDYENYNPWPGFSFTGKLRPFPQTPKRILPESIVRPDYADNPEGISMCENKLKGSTNIEVLSEEDIQKMKVACKLGREVLDETIKAIDIGITTDELDRIAHEACIERDCYPSPLNYYKFPKSCCTSINEVICHGIPDQRPLQDGDIINVDITVYHRGFHGDLNETIFVGDVSDKAKELVQTTYECLDKAIAACRPGVRYREMGDIIQKHAQSHGFSVVRTYCGHGIHRLFHTAPSVPHYAKNKAVGIMKPGHTFTIEPMISEGQWRDKTWPDDWTSVTCDGKLSAQFEHTLLITDDGVEVLTRNLDDGTPHFMKQPQFAK